MTKAACKMNPKNKPNGHGALLAKGNGASGRTISLSGLDRAASVDASELSVANAAASSAVAGAGRDAYAEVAPSEGTEKRCSSAGAASPRNSKEEGIEQQQKKVPGGSEPLPIDAEAFVDAVHSRVDLVLLEEKLLNSKDDKIVQRELAYLRELRYGKRAGTSDDEPTQIIFDMPGPERDKQ
jgi:hypothetical protein